MCRLVKGDDPKLALFRSAVVSGIMKRYRTAKDTENKLWRKTVVVDTLAHPYGMRLWNQVSKLLGMDKDTCRNGMRVRIELKVFKRLNM